jgi:hypothetical protein
MSGSRQPSPTASGTFVRPNHYTSRTFHPNHAGQSRRQEESAMSILIGILITFLVIVLVLYLVQRLPLDAKARQIAQIVVIIIGILSLLKYLAVF